MCPYDVGAGLFTEAIFQPVVILKSNSIHPLTGPAWTESSTQDTGEKLHAIISFQRQAVPFDMAVQGHQVVPMILGIVPGIEHLVHFVVQPDMVSPQAAQLKIHPRADCGDKVILGLYSRGRLAALKENVVVVPFGHCYVGSHAHRPKGINQKVAGVEGQRPRACCKKSCRNCNTTPTASRTKHLRSLGQSNTSEASQTR